MNATMPTELETLREQIRRGGRFKYLLFWGHTAERSDAVGRECLSQWYPARFALEGESFQSAEHYMMWSKARLFEDGDAARAVLAASSPAHAKRIGRSVKNFDEARWVSERLHVVVRGSVAKFSQNQALTSYLRNTKQRVLVEASPVDRIWGVGLDAAHEHAQNPLEWRGLNLLGFALMRAREQLFNEDRSRP